MSLGKKITFAFFASSLLYGVNSPSFSFTPETIDVTPIKVTATRNEKDILDVPMAISVITAEEIAKQGSVDLADILRCIPGIRVSSVGNESNQIKVRGENSGTTLVLVDGVKVSAEYTTMHNTQLPYISPSSIERIEVIKGPASVLYGSEALGGVINIITKKGGIRPIQGEISSSYSTDRDAVILAGSLFGKVNDFEYRFSGSYDHLGDVMKYHEPQKNTDRENGALTSYIAYNFTENIKLGAGYDYSKSRFQNEDLSYSPEYKVRESHRFYTDLTVKNVTSFLPTIKANFYYLDNKYTTPSYSNGVLASETINSLDNYGASLQSDWVIGEHTYIIAGYDWLHETYDDERPNYSRKENQVRESSADTHAAYLTFEHYLPANFALNYGARFTHYSTDFSGSRKLSSVGDWSTVSDPKSGSESDVVFNIGLVWTGIDNLALRATFAQGYKAPSFYMKYLDIPMTFGNSFIANPDLESETIDNYEIGARYSNGKLLLDASLFYSKSKNRLDTNKYVVDGKGYTQWINQADSTAWGLELASSYKFDFGLEPYVSATWMRRKSSELAGGGEMKYDKDEPSFYATVGLRYENEIYENIFLNADLNLNYQSAVVVETGEYVGFTFVKTGEFDDTVTTLNLSLGAEFGQERNFFTQLNINNLLDQKYFYSDSADYEPGINGTLIFGYRF